MKALRIVKAALVATVSAFALTATAHAQDIYTLGDNINAQLAAAGKDYRVAMVETITDGDSNEVGSTILFRNLGNRHLAFDFVPGDPRAPWSGPGPDITFALDDVDLTADLAGTTELDEIRAAMATWDAEQCSNLPLVDLGDTGVDVGVFEAIVGGLGSTGGIAADVQHAGFLPASFFTAVFGVPNILGVTFTFIWVSGGNPTDIDNNHYNDAAFREIYYNDGFTWEVDPNDVPGDGRFDIQTVALHEAGHGLSQGHFGTGRINNQTGRIQLSPQAVMNAGYIFGQQSLLGTDQGGHCSNWANWPNN